MKLCFCRFLLAVGIVVLALVWGPEAWAKWVIVAAAALLVGKMGYCRRRRTPGHHESFL
jgi:Flp pilus assembly protein TadB